MFPLKRTGTNQSWFPESWSESDIANAGAYNRKFTTKCKCG